MAVMWLKNLVLQSPNKSYNAKADFPLLYVEYISMLFILKIS